MNQEELSEKANEAINAWASDSDKLIIAIDGYTGVGKTTLLDNLVKLNPDILAVNRDDFMLPRKIVHEKIANSEDRSKVFELEVIDSPKLTDFITAFKNTNTLYNINTYDGVSGEVSISKTFDFSKKIMAIEGVFMFHPELPHNKFWDKRIYLEGDITKIAERRIKREKERWGKDYFPETHPDSYFKQVCIALDRYIASHHPEKSADLVLRVE